MPLHHTILRGQIQVKPEEYTFAAMWNYVILDRNYERSNGPDHENA